MLLGVVRTVQLLGAERAKCVLSVNYQAQYGAGHCKKLAPAWSNLGQSFQNDSDVVIAHVDCTKAKQVCSNAKVS